MTESLFMREKDGFSHTNHTLRARENGTGLDLSLYVRHRDGIEFHLDFDQMLALKDFLSKLEAKA